MAAFFLSASSAGAQDELRSKIEARLVSAAKKLEAACHDTLAKYCGTVTPGEGRLLLCLAAHEDKIDSKCDYALYDASRNLEGALDRMEQAADACWHDIETHCADMPAGEGHIAQCLMHKRASLSPPCQHELEKFAK
jgi:Golgi apparatus protein 1